MLEGRATREALERIGKQYAKGFRSGAVMCPYCTVRKECVKGRVVPYSGPFICDDPAAYADAAIAQVRGEMDKGADEAAKTLKDLDRLEAPPNKLLFPTRKQQQDGRFLCNKENPMPEEHEGQWAHEDIEVLNDDPEVDHCKCCVCGTCFKRHWSK